MDFRGSLDIDSEDEQLPDILRHTKSKTRKPVEEIYESLDRYQVKDIQLIFVRIKFHKELRNYADVIRKVETKSLENKLGKIKRWDCF